MFDNYIDHLAQELEELNQTEVMEDFLEFQKSPQKGYEDYIERFADEVFYTDQQCEAYQEALWDEFDEPAVKEVYEDRLKALQAEAVGVVS
jgi:hypothetical protein